MARFIMTVDPARCTGCMACVMACKVNNAVEPDQSRNWVRVTPAGDLPTGMAFQPGACMHCAEPLCVEACPTGATFVDENHVVQVHNNLCIACGSCAEACPYGARHINAGARRIDKCDYCGDSLVPLGLEPACVGVCPTRARIFGDADDPDSEVAAILGSRRLEFVESRETPTSPRLAYLSEVRDKYWPKAAGIPLAIGLMAPVAAASRWLGGLTLLGLAAVALRQLFNPPGKEGEGDD